jgi:hypothetical protein
MYLDERIRAGECPGLLLQAKPPIKASTYVQVILITFVPMSHVCCRETRKGRLCAEYQVGISDSGVVDGLLLIDTLRAHIRRGRMRNSIA